MTDPARRRRRTIPTQLAALAIGVSEATIRKWASRGKLTRYGTPGRAEYDLEELFRLAELRANSRAEGSAQEPRAASELVANAD